MRVGDEEAHSARASLQHADARPPDAWDVASVAAFGAVAAVSSVAMLLVWLSHLRVLPLAVLSAIACVVTIAWVRRSRTDAMRTRRPTARSTVAVLALAGLSGVLFLQPAEYVFDGADESIYMAIAGVLQQHGSVSPGDPLAASLTASDRQALFPLSPWPERPGRFPGGIQLSADGTRLQPGFFHLLPALVASASLVFGSAAGWYVNPVLAMGSVLLVWLIGRRLSGAFTGEWAAVLLLINVAQVWFARVPSSEVLTQFLVLSGLYLAVLAEDTQWIAPAAGAGAAFGLLAWSRIDMLLLVTPAIAVLIVLAARLHGLTRQMAWTAAVFAMLTLPGAVYGLTVSQPYSLRVIVTFKAYLETHPGTLLLAGGALALVIGIVALANRIRSLMPVAMVVVAAAGLTLLAALMWKDFTKGYFLRLIPPAAVVLGIAGLVALLLGPERRRAAPMVLLFLVGLVYLRTPFDDRIMPGVFRRYVPILLPILLIGVAHAVQAARTRWRPGAALILAPPILCVWFAWQTSPIVAHPVMRMGRAELAKVAAVTEASSLLVWEAGALNHLPLAAQYALGRESILVPNDDAAAEPTRRIVDAALAAGRPVHLVIDARRREASPWRRWFDHLEITGGRSIDIRTEHLVAGAGDFPFSVDQRDHRHDFYQLHATPAGPLAGLPLRIDIGERDMPYLLDGFHAIERHGGVAVRWTTAVARLRVPAMDVPAGQQLRMVLRLATHRPTDGPVALALEWDGRPIGHLTAGQAAAEYDVRLPVVDPTRGGVLTLRSATFVPRDAGMGHDGRVLGVLVDWIVIDTVAADSVRKH